MTRRRRRRHLIRINLELITPAAFATFPYLASSAKQSRNRWKSWHAINYPRVSKVYDTSLRAIALVPSSNYLDRCFLGQTVLDGVIFAANRGQDSFAREKKERKTRPAGRRNKRGTEWNARNACIYFSRIRVTSSRLIITLCSLPFNRATHTLWLKFPRSVALRL